MVKKIIITAFAAALILSQQNFISAQKRLPVIKATSETVDIREDNLLMEGKWRIAPDVNPDILESSAKKVTFYTDIDSISFDIAPQGVYDFVVLLNGKDSAYTQIRHVASYLEKLKKAHEYNINDNRTIPEFSYQPMDHPDLVKVRQTLKLDSIAGEGSEILQILNLMHWLHNTIRHDGSSNNPINRNAIDLINVCKVENRGVNCRMLATILNECYLAMGFKSRFITCMPRETEFDDCHVINMVYSNSLRKWIWIDPSFDAYVMDEKGELLGPEEVRDRLITGKPLILNPDANWNRQQAQIKEEYLEKYMAKNLYRIEAIACSKYDTETRTSGKEITYIELLPLDGIEQLPQRDEFHNKETNVTTTNYKTNNPKLFWAKP